jgi:glycerol-3-phosphate acyltransferase PlsY
LISNALKSIGVAIRRIKRTLKELKRKTLHLSALIIPIGYHLLLTFVNGFTQYYAIIIVTIGTVFWLTLDVARIYIPFINRNFPLQSLAREKERHNLSGVTYFGIGCWLAVVWFPPRIAITALLYMILGDMSAAIFGISFGRIKIGHKSLEGTFAMFTVCSLIGFNMFWDIHMREYPVIMAAVIASVVELLEPFGLNDNLTIPLLSCFALQFGFHRISTCEEFTDWKQYLDYQVVEKLVRET